MRDDRANSWNFICVQINNDQRNIVTNINYCGGLLLRLQLPLDHGLTGAGTSEHLQFLDPETDIMGHYLEGETDP